MTTRGMPTGFLCGLAAGLIGIASVVGTGIAPWLRPLFNVAAFLPFAAIVGGLALMTSRSSRRFGSGLALGSALVLIPSLALVWWVASTIGS